MDKLVNVFDFINTVINPIFWIRLCRYSKDLDDFVINALKDPDLRIVLEHTGDRAEINGVTLWIKNYPYAYGELEKDTQLVPSRRTVIKLKRAIDKHIEAKRLSMTNGLNDNYFK